MAHPDQFQFIDLVKRHFPAYFDAVNVLEIGSLDINGSIRSAFENARYIGVDVGEGPGVDHVCQGQNVSFQSEYFDVVLSCECLEHNPFWAETLSNMFRMLRPGGLFAMSCATTGRKEHGTSRTTSKHSPLTVDIGWEYYRNLRISDIRKAVNLDWWMSDWAMLCNWNAYDLYLVGIKKPFSEPDKFAALRRDLNRAFGPLRSIRSSSVFAAVHILGDNGYNTLRKTYRIFQ